MITSFSLQAFSALQEEQIEQIAEYSRGEMRNEYKESSSPITFGGNWGRFAYGNASLPYD
jgi:hypothetical protein